MQERTLSSRHPFLRRPSAARADGAELRAAVRRAWRRTAAPVDLADSPRATPSSHRSASANDVVPAAAGDDAARLNALAYANAKYGRDEDVPWSALGEGAAAAILTSAREPGEEVGPLVASWVAEHGAAAAIDALVAERTFLVTRNGRRVTLASQGPDSSYVGGGVPGKWRSLRASLCEANDDVYDAALTHATTLRARAGLSLRCALAYLFPGRPDWAAEDARTALRPPPPVGRFVALLFASLDEADLVLALLASTSGRPRWRGLDVRDIEGATADGRLAVGLLRVATRRDEIVDAMARLRGLRAATLAALHEAAPAAVTRAFIRFLGDPNGENDAVAYFVANPREAMAALAEALAAGRRRAVIAPVLASLVATHRDDALALAHEATPTIARALAESGASIEPLGAAAAKKLGPAIARVDLAPLAAWAREDRTLDALRRIVRDAATDDERVRSLASFATACAAASISLATTVVDALAETGTEPCLRALAKLSSHALSPPLVARARERLRNVHHLDDDDAEDLAAPRSKVTARDRAAQAHRLERAMVEGRRWTVPRFRAAVLGNRVLVEIAASLLWGSFSAEDELVAVFRVTKGGALEGEDGKAPPLGAATRIGVVHAGELTPRHQRWARTTLRGAQAFTQIDRAGIWPPAAFPAKRPVRKVLAELVSAGWARDDRSAGPDGVGYYRLVRGWEARLVVDGASFFGFELYGEPRERARAVAALEAGRDVARAFGTQSAKRGPTRVSPR